MALHLLVDHGCLNRIVTKSTEKVNLENEGIVAIHRAYDLVRAGHANTAEDGVGAFVRTITAAPVSTEFNLAVDLQIGGASRDLTC